MNDVPQGEWARRLCHTDKADQLAKHYKNFYELCAARTDTLTANKDPHRYTWGVIAAMADEIKRLDEAIAALQGKPAPVVESKPEVVEPEVMEEPANDAGEQTIKRGPGRPRKLVTAGA